MQRMLGHARWFVDALAAERVRLGVHNEALRTYARRQAERVQALVRQCRDAVPPGADPAEWRRHLDALDADVTSDLDFMEAQYRLTLSRKALRRELAAERRATYPPSTATQRQWAAAEDAELASAAAVPMPPSASDADAADAADALPSPPHTPFTPFTPCSSLPKAPTEASSPTTPATTAASSCDGSAAFTDGSASPSISVTSSHDDWLDTVRGLGRSYDDDGDPDGTVSDSISLAPSEDDDTFWDTAAAGTTPRWRPETPAVDGVAALRSFLETEPLLREAERLLRRLVRRISDADVLAQPLPDDDDDEAETAAAAPAAPAANAEPTAAVAASPALQPGSLLPAFLGAASAVPDAGAADGAPRPAAPSPMEVEAASTGPSLSVTVAAGDAAAPPPPAAATGSHQATDGSRLAPPAPPQHEGGLRRELSVASPALSATALAARGPLPRRLYDLAQALHAQTEAICARLVAVEVRERRRRKMNSMLDAKIHEIAHRLTEDRGRAVCGQCGRRCKRCR